MKKLILLIAAVVATINCFAQLTYVSGASMQSDTPYVYILHNRQLKFIKYVEPGGSSVLNLSYTAATRALGISGGGTGVTLPLFNSTTAGLTPLSGGGTTNYLRADGTWAAPPVTNSSAGINNYIAKFNGTGAGVLANTNMTHSGSTVTINDGVLAFNLSGYGVRYSAGYQTGVFRMTANNTVNKYGWDGLSGQVYSFSLDSANVSGAMSYRILMGNVNRFVIDNDGDIGIGYGGTVSFAEKFNVTGNGVFTGNVTVANLAYNATTWNGNSTVPTRDDIRDKFESLATGGDIVNGGNSGVVTIGSNDNTLNLESNGVTRVTYASTGVTTATVPDNTVGAWLVNSGDGQSFITATTTNAAPRMVLGSAENGGAVGQVGIRYEDVQSITSTGSFTATKSTIGVNLASTGTVTADVTGWPTSTTVASNFIIINVDALGAGVDVTVALTGATWHSGSNPVLTPGQSVNCKLLNGVLYIL